MNVEAINIGPSDAIAPVDSANALAGKGLMGTVISTTRAPSPARR